MKRLRRTLSFRKPEGYIPESCRPHVWEQDSQKVRTGGVSFPVKYLGCLEVNESRGTQVCAEAAKQLKALSSSAKKKRMTLLVTSECVRLIDEDTKSLAVDQTIEKVSFCTPDPNNERLFSYISRDGTTRRWMCHSFMAVRDSGERISHAVGCAFTACLQRKQKAMAAQQIAEQQQKSSGESSPPSPKTGANTLTPTPAQVSPTAKVEPISITPNASPVSQSPETKVQSPPAVSQLQNSSSGTSTQWQQQKLDSEWDTLTQGISALTNGPTALPTIPQSPVTPPQATVSVTQTALSPPPAAATKGATTATGATPSTTSSSIARRRPVPFNPSPFTRHMSLRTKANPLTFAPLREGNGKYETLAEENTPPRLQEQSMVDVQPKHVIQPHVTQPFQNVPLSTQNFTSQTSAPQMIQQQDLFIQHAPYQANGNSQNLNSQNIVMQNHALPQSNQWPQSSGALRSLPLTQTTTADDMWTTKGQHTVQHPVQAEQWLASAQATGTGVPSQGILTPKNPFSLHNNGLNATQTFASNPWGNNTPNSNGADDFASLAERHNFSPTSPSSGAGNNPFRQENNSVFWV